MRKTQIATILGMIMLMATAGALSACNTTAGAGKDVSATGHAVTRAAEDAK